MKTTPPELAKTLMSTGDKAIRAAAQVSEIYFNIAVNALKGPLGTLKEAEKEVRHQRDEAIKRLTNHEDFYADDPVCLLDRLASKARFVDNILKAQRTRETEFVRALAWAKRQYILFGMALGAIIAIPVALFILAHAR